MTYLKHWKVIKVQRNPTRELAIRVHCHVNGELIGAEYTVTAFQLKVITDCYNEVSKQIFRERLTKWLVWVIGDLTKRLDNNVRIHCSDFPIDSYNFEYTTEVSDG